MDGQKLELVKHIGNELACIEPVIPHPILHQKVSVFVSHVDTPTSVWLQRASNSELLTELVDRMYIFYEEGGQAKDLEPKENAVCAAKSVNDGAWYRAKVLSISGEGIQVLFLDYGNGELVPAENIKALDSSLYLPHALAFNVSLPVVVKITVESEALAEMTSDVEYLAVFHRDDEGSWYSELFDKKETLTDKLVEQGYVEQMENYPFSTFVEEITKLPKLVIGMQVLMYVSHVDSPGRFWIQREEGCDEIEKLQANLQAAIESFEVLVDPACNALCAALCLGDGKWYRATVLEVTDLGVLVRYVDYGNTGLIDVSSNPLKVLPPRFAKYDMYAVLCGLNVLPLDSESEFSAEAMQSFKALVAETEGVLLAEVVAERGCWIIDIFLGDKSFAASLIADNLVMEFSEENSVYVSHVNSPAEFWIQAERSTKRLETIADRMAVANEFEPLADITDGILCAAQFVDDEQWYRARVGSQAEQGFKVEFIDYGNSAISTELRTLPQDLAAILPVAKRCSLQVLDGQSECWMEKAKKIFEELVAEGATLFSVEVLKDEENENPAVVQLTKGGKNVSEILLTDKLVEQGYVEQMENVHCDEEPEMPIEEEMRNGNVEDFPETSTEEKEDQFHDTVESLPEPSDNTLQEAISAVEELLLLPDSDLTMDKLIEPSQEEYLDVPAPMKLEKTIESSQEEYLDVPAPMKLEKTIESSQEDVPAPMESDKTIESSQEDVPAPMKLEKTIESSQEDVPAPMKLEKTIESSQEEYLDVPESTTLIKPIADMAREEKSDESEQESPIERVEPMNSQQESTDVEVPDEGAQENMAGISQLGEDNDRTQVEVDSVVMQMNDTLNVPLPTKDEIEEDVGAHEATELVIEPLMPDLVHPVSPKPGDVGHTITRNQDEVKSVSRPMTPINRAEKIVPGSISRGISLEELHRASLEPWRSSPRNMAEKIVPGSISRGVSDEELQKMLFCPINPKFEHSDNLLPDSEGSLERIPEVAQSCPATPIPSSNHPMQRASSVEMESPYKERVKHADRIVPGCISSGVSTEEIKATSHEDFEKIKHGERIVPGSISRGVSAEEVEFTNQEDSDVVPPQNVNGSGIE